MPTVFYVHCEAGVDRTGEVSGILPSSFFIFLYFFFQIFVFLFKKKKGSYYIRWLGWSWEQALDYDNSVIDRDMETLSRSTLFSSSSLISFFVCVFSLIFFLCSRKCNAVVLLPFVLLAEFYFP